MSDTVLVAIDGSKNSLAALKEGLAIAEPLGLKVVLVNVQPNYNTLHTRMFINSETIKEYQEEVALDTLKEAIETMKNKEVEWETRVLIGDPKREICHLAKERHAKYIIMGSRGMGAVKGAVLGSVSYGILHECVCPVLIVPSQSNE